MSNIILINKKVTMPISALKSQNLPAVLAISTSMTGKKTEEELK